MKNEKEEDQIPPPHTMARLVYDIYEPFSVRHGYKAGQASKVEVEDVRQDKEQKAASA